ncbi:hypothetical protein ACHAQH_003014 [Verticillium albo-atrum]
MTNAYVQQRLRAATGRVPYEARTLNANTPILTYTHGSALVRVGDNTAIRGVRDEIFPATNIPNYRTSALDGDNGGRPELRDYDLLFPSIELACP